jgi:multicomponent Na+:H+ antiporter subunit A
MSEILANAINIVQSVLFNSNSINIVSKVFFGTSVILGILITIYSLFYIKKNRVKFSGTIFLFIISAGITFTSNNLICLLTGWELMSVISYFLVKFDKSRESQRSAMIGLITTLIGGSFLTTAIILLNQHNIFSLIDLKNLENINTLSKEMEMIISGLLLIGIITKSAQYPFYFWVLKAMRASAPVSAYLHSATLIKGGLYLLLQLLYFSSKFEFLYRSSFFIGILTVLICSIKIFRTNKVKEIIALTTINSVGVLIISISLAYTNYSRDLIIKHEIIRLICIFVVSHAIYKSSLFLVNGLFSNQKITEIPFNIIYIAISFLCLYNSSGLIFSLGSLSKSFWIIYINEGILLELFIITAQGLNSSIIAFLIFSSTRNKRENICKKRSIVVFFILGLSFIGYILYKKFFSTSTLNTSLPNHYYWIYFCSLVLFTLYLIYINWSKKRLFHVEHFFSSSFLIIRIIKFTRIKCIRFITFIKNLKTENINQNIRNILRIFIYTLVVIVFLDGIFWHEKILDHIENLISKSTLDISTLSIIFFTLISIIGMRVIIRSENQLSESSKFMILNKNYFIQTLVGLNLIGGSIGCIYLLLGAPDVSMTHFLCEGLGTIFIIIIFHNVDRSRIIIESHSREYILQFILLGILILGILIGIDSMPFNQILNEIYLQLPGENVVNMIITDYRGFDTWGEMTVLALGGIVIKELSHHINRSFDIERGDYFIVSEFLKFIVTTSIALSIYTLFESHRIPGGGFSSGLIFGTLLAVCRMCNKRLIRLRFESFINTGIIVSIFSSLTPIFLGKEFFTNMIGDFSFAILFDIGIMFIVIGMSESLLSIFNIYEDKKSTRKKEKKVSVSGKFI